MKNVLGSWSLRRSADWRMHPKWQETIGSLHGSYPTCCPKCFSTSFFLPAFQVTVSLTHRDLLLFSPNPVKKMMMMGLSSFIFLLKMMDCKASCFCFSGKLMNFVGFFVWWLGELLGHWLLSRIHELWGLPHCRVCNGSISHCGWFAYCCAGSVSDDYIYFMLWQFPTNVAGWASTTIVTDSLLTVWVSFSQLNHHDLLSVVKFLQQQQL